MNRQQSVSHTLANATEPPSAKTLSELNNHRVRKAFVEFFFGLRNHSERLPLWYSLLLSALSIIRSLTMTSTSFSYTSGIQHPLAAFGADIVLQLVIMLVGGMGITLCLTKILSRDLNPSGDNCVDSWYTCALAWLLPVHNFICLPRLVALIAVSLFSIGSEGWQAYWIYHAIGSLCGVAIATAHIILGMSPVPQIDWLSATSATPKITLMVVPFIMQFSTILAQTLKDSTLPTNVAAVLLLLKSAISTLSVLVVRTNTFFNSKVNEDVLVNVVLMVACVVVLLDLDKVLVLVPCWNGMSKGIHFAVSALCALAGILIRNLTGTPRTIKSARQCIRFAWMVCQSRFYNSSSSSLKTQRSLMDWCSAVRNTLVSRNPHASSRLRDMSCRELALELYDIFLQDNSLGSKKGISTHIGSIIQFLSLMPDIDDGLLRLNIHLAKLSSKSQTNITLQLGLRSLKRYLEVKLVNKFNNHVSASKNAGKYATGTKGSKETTFGDVNLSLHSVEALSANKDFIVLVRLIRRSVELVTGYYTKLQNSKASLRHLHNLACQLVDLDAKVTLLYSKVRQCSNDSTLALLHRACYMHLLRNKHKDTNELLRTHCLRQRNHNKPYAQRKLSTNLMLGKACMLVTSVQPEECGAVHYSAGSLPEGLSNNWYNLMSDHLHEEHERLVQSFLASGHTSTGNPYLGGHRARLIRLNNGAYVKGQVTVSLAMNADFRLYFIIAIETGSRSESFIVTDEQDCAIGASMGLELVEPGIIRSMKGRKLPDILSMLQACNSPKNRQSALLRQLFHTRPISIEEGIFASAGLASRPETKKFDLEREVRTADSDQMLAGFKSSTLPPPLLRYQMGSSGIEEAAFSVSINGPILQHSRSNEASGEEKENSNNSHNNQSVLRNRDTGNEFYRSDGAILSHAEILASSKTKTGKLVSSTHSHLLMSFRNKSFVGKSARKKTIMNDQLRNNEQKPMASSRVGEEKNYLAEDQGSSIATSMRVVADRVRLTLQTPSAMRLLGPLLASLLGLSLAIVATWIITLLMAYSSLYRAVAHLDTMRLANPLCLEYALTEAEGIAAFVQAKLIGMGIQHVNKFEFIAPGLQFEITDRRAALLDDLTRLNKGAESLLGRFDEQSWTVANSFKYNAVLPLMAESSKNSSLSVKYYSRGLVADKQFRMLIDNEHFLQFNSTVYRQTSKYFWESVRQICVPMNAFIINTGTEQFIGNSKYIFRLVVVLTIIAVFFALLMLSSVFWFAKTIVKVYSAHSLLEDGEILFKKERLEHFDRWLHSSTLRLAAPTDKNQSLPNAENISTYKRVLSKSKNAKNRCKPYRPTSYFFNAGWPIVAVFFVLLLWGGIFMMCMNTVSSRRARQFELVVRHRTLSRCYFGVSSIQQLIYDAIIIKAGLRTDVTLAKQKATLDAQFSFAKDILKAGNAAYFVEPPADEAAAFNSLSMIAKPCELDYGGKLTEERCRKLGHGAVQKGVLGMLDWQVFTSENIASRVFSVASVAEIWPLLKTRDWLEFEFMMSFMYMKQWKSINESFQHSIQEYFGNYETWLWNMVYIYQALVLLVSAGLMTATAKIQQRVCCASLFMLGCLPSPSLVLNSRVKKLLSRLHAQYY